MARMTITNLTDLIRGEANPRGLKDFYFWLAFLSVLDVALTSIILTSFQHMGGREVNGLAEAIIEHYGLFGVALFKFACVGSAAAICVYISERRVTTARRLGAALLAVASFPVIAAAAQLAMVAVEG